MIRFYFYFLSRIFLFGLFTFYFGACSKPFPSGDEIIFLGLVNRTEYLFVTSATFDGALGGVAGADLKCAAAKPADASDLPGLDLEYVALLAGPGRTPSGAGWPLRTNTNYYTNTPTMTLVLHTDASALPVLPMDSAAGIPGVGDYWTGLGSPIGSASTNCNGWTDATFSFDADYGSSGNNTITGFNNGFANTCDTPGVHLLCVRN